MLQQIKEEAIKEFEEISRTLVGIEQHKTWWEIRTYTGCATQEQIEFIDSLITKTYRQWFHKWYDEWQTARADYESDK